MPNTIHFDPEDVTIKKIPRDACDCGDDAEVEVFLDLRCIGLEVSLGCYCNGCAKDIALCLKRDLVEGRSHARRRLGSKR